MSPPPSSDDGHPAAQAWARYRRLMRFMMTITLLMVGAACIALYARSGEDALVSAHFYVATALGIGFAMLLMSALMGLVFLSNASGHDEAVTQPFDTEEDDED